MNDFITSFILGAGVGTFMYVKFGRRVGYGNGQTIWMMVGATFIIGFIFFYTLTRYFIHLH